MAQNNFNILMEQIIKAPLWVQEVIYHDIKDRLKAVLPAFSFEETDASVYPAIKPEITFKGKKELETHEQNLHFNIYKYLKSALEGQRVVDITLNNFWTLEESSRYLGECIQKEFIKAPANFVVNASIFYLGGFIRLGEYVKKIDKIDVNSLDNILRKQKRHNEANPDAQLKIGEIMLDMGVVANKDIDKIIHIKEESKKRFILTAEIKGAVQPATNLNKPTFPQQPETIPPTGTTNVPNEELLKKLMIENKLLKDKLRAVFNIQNKKQ